MTPAAVSHQVSVTTQDDVVAARRQARAMAIELGFDAFAVAAITTATSELARNVFVHGGGGFVTIETLRTGERLGLCLTFCDEGPGIEDVEQALQGGFSTKRSLGLGLSGSRRLVDEFELTSTPGEGTKVRVVKWTRR